jgi:hypothetical protein
VVVGGSLRVLGITSKRSGGSDERADGGRGTRAERSRQQRGALSLSATSEADFFCSFLPFHHPSSSRLQLALAEKHERQLCALSIIFSAVLAMPSQPRSRPIRALSLASPTVLTLDCRLSSPTSRTPISVFFVLNPHETKELVTTGLVNSLCCLARFPIRASCTVATGDFCAGAKLKRI